MSEQMSLFGTDKYKIKRDKSKRKAPIDLIYTLQGADATCCLAVRAGMGYGIQSKSFRLCPYLDKHKGDAHHVMFCDNEYSEYNHERHIKGLAKVVEAQGSLIKYATVRDIMSPEQCEAAGIEWFSFSQIMRWAKDVQEFAENVIVIPKVREVIADIPDKYVLGYSVPSSHGGTPLLTDDFRGRKVHLLGGSWRDQIKYWLDLWDEVVSLDNNHCQKIAQYGSMYWPDGSVKKVTEDLHMPQLVNPRYVCLAVSFGHMVGYARYLQRRSEVIDDAES